MSLKKYNMNNPIQTLKRIDEIRTMFQQNMATQTEVDEAVEIYFNMPSGMSKMYIYCKLTVDTGGLKNTNINIFVQAIASDLANVVNNDHHLHHVPDYWWSEDFRQQVGPVGQYETMHDGLMSFSIRDMFDNNCQVPN